MSRGTVILHESVYEGQRRERMRAGLPVPYAKGICLWCGEPIELVEGAHSAMRQRTRHRGDEFEITDRNCRKAYFSSVAYSERELVEQRGDPECVDCGRTSDWWDADHDIPLWAGGGHDAVNIVRRCVPCHKEKTKREAGERAALRRQERGIPDPEPEHHPGQESMQLT